MKKFSLIELLIVIAIIGILVSILMPSLGRARESARNVLCMNNLKQMYTGFHVYARDNSGYYLQTKLVSQEDVSLHAWKTSQAVHLRENYMGTDFSSFYCPLDDRSETMRQNMWNWGGGPGGNNSVVGYSKWSNKRITNLDHYQESVDTVNNNSPLLGDLFRQLFGSENYFHKFSSDKIKINFCSGAGGVRTYDKSSFKLNYGNGNNQFFWPEME